MNAVTSREYFADNRPNVTRRLKGNGWFKAQGSGTYVLPPLASRI